MAFKFRFATVLRLALHEEEEVRKLLIAKDAQIAEMDRKIETVMQEQQSALVNKSKALMAGDMITVRMFPAYMFRLDRAKEFHEEEKGRLQKQREKILQELTEKRRVRKIYEKLRERDEKKYQKKQLKIDQKRMDDFAGRGRHLLKSSSEDNQDV
ncbi:MAG: flagellar export protein FliJ [Candidatus Riflebacteria bacterium]|nr:flagellar export protein FliJ [Candidatus Riflebacteria bacterium]